MPADHHRQQTIDRILGAVRDAADAGLRSHAEVVAEVATDELRRDAAAQVAQLRETVQRLELTRIDVESQLAEARRLLTDARRDAEDQVAALTASYNAALGDLAGVRAALEDSRRTADAAVAAERRRADAATEQLQAARAGEPHGLPAEALRALDEAGSLAGALDCLTELAARSAQRVAVLLIRNDALSIWRAVGFDSDAAAAHRTIPASQLLAIAQREGQCVVQPHVDGDSSLLPAFARCERPLAVLVCPLLIGNTVVAMLYADAAPGEGIHPPTWARSIETLARYAGRVIESLTVHLALAARSHLVQPSQGAAASSSLASEGAR